MMFLGRWGEEKWEKQNNMRKNAIRSASLIATSILVALLIALLASRQRKNLKRGINGKNGIAVLMLMGNAFHK